MFAYYPADYTLAGGRIPAPEFGIYGSTEFMTRANHITGLLCNDLYSGPESHFAPQPFVPNATGTPSPTLAAFVADAADADKLVSHLDRLFLHGTMSADARRTIVNAVNKIPAGDRRARALLASTSCWSRSTTRYSGEPAMTRTDRAIPLPRRRELLKWLSAAGVLVAAGPRASFAQSGGDYKALVCVYLYGGNDGENTLIRYDSAGYQTYASIRAPASGVNIPQAQLLPIQPARGGPPYGFHPACAALQALFQQGKLAVVANTGALVAPSTKAGLEQQQTPRPANLFSHNDQQLAQQSADYTGQVRLGWGGRIADRLDAVNGSTLFPALTSMNGIDTFVNGATSVPLAIPGTPTFSMFGSGYPLPQFDALREAAIREMLAQSRDNAYDAVARLYASEGLASASVAAPILGNAASVVTPLFAGLSSQSPNQLRNVALLIEGRGQTRLKRQVFFVGQLGYDTHGGQLEHPSAIARRPFAGDEGLPGCDGRARHEQQRDGVHADGFRSCPQARRATTGPITAGATTPS